jgi:hypothetical protein
MAKGGVVFSTLQSSRPVLTASKPKSLLDTELTEPELQDEEGEDGQEIEPVEAEANDREPAAPRRRTAPRAPKFLSELNLTTADVPLEEFVKSKKPESILERYAVICAWFKQHFGTEEISVDHVFTAFRALGWQGQVPADPGQPLRDLKSKHWIDSGKSRGYYKINWNGENAVNKMGAAGI